MFFPPRPPRSILFRFPRFGLSSCRNWPPSRASVTRRAVEGGRGEAWEIRNPKRIQNTEVYIEEGSVWINGQRLEPPESLRGLKYVSEFPQAWDAPEFWGTADGPAKLGAGEYFVLGDFSQISADSRTWQTGDPGHPSYAVLKSHIFGVVTHFYWPPGRWRILR